MMTEKIERQLVAALREVLEPLAVGDSIPHTDSWRAACAALERWWPAVHGWENEDTLDAFDFVSAIKTGDRSLRCHGLALFLTDWAWTPCAATLRIDAVDDRLDFFSLFFGQRGDGALGLNRSVKYNSTEAKALRNGMLSDPPSEGWVFHAIRIATAPETPDTH